LPPDGLSLPPHGLTSVCALLHDSIGTRAVVSKPQASCLFACRSRLSVVLRFLVRPFQSQSTSYLVFDWTSFLREAEAIPHLIGFVSPVRLMLAQGRPTQAPPILRQPALPCCVTDLAKNTFMNRAHGTDGSLHQGGWPLSYSIGLSIMSNRPFPSEATLVVQHYVKLLLDMDE